MALQHLRSSTAHKRPLPAGVSDGQLAINTNLASPGVFFKDSNGDLVKVGPVHVGATAPNASPASGGQTGNTKGEQWLDTSGTNPVLKVWDGSAWQSEAGEFVNASGDTMTGALVMDNQQQVRFREATANGTNYIAIQAPASVGSDRTLTLPDATGTLVSTGDTGTVTSTMIANGTIVDVDVNASAAIAGTKISPDFGSQNVTTTGTVTGASLIPSSSTIPTNGVYLPAANTVGISTNSTERLRVDASGRVLVGTSTARTNFLSAGVTAQTQLEGTDANTTSFVITRNSVNSASSILGFAKSKGAAVGSNTIVIDGDQLGRINFAGSDGTSFILAAEIEARIDGTPGTNSMPGRIVLSTTASGASAPTERLRIDSSGRTLIGTTSALNVGSYSSGFEGFQVAGTTSAARASLSRWDASTADPGITLAKSRGGTVGTNGIVSSSDNIGRVEFTADDGTSFLTAARILAQVDGTPGTNDMPGRLIFSTTADGASTPTEAMRINNAQELLIGYTTDNGAYRLQVNSQIFATSATIATSDGRYKENIATLNGCIDLVKALRPVSFDWKPQQDITRINDDGNEVLVREGHNFPGGTQVGFIAQEVQTVLAGKPWLNSVIKQNVRPAVISSDGNVLAPEEEFLGIAEGNLISVLTSALKESIERIETLEAKVAALEGA
jgi:hypothetical protein